MTHLVFALIAAWLAARLWLEWKVEQEWLPGTEYVRDDYTFWWTPPPNAMTPAGERLWVLRFRVTLWGFLAVVAIVVLVATA